MGLNIRHINKLIPVLLRTPYPVYVLFTHVIRKCPTKARDQNETIHTTQPQ